ncbi:hypothetical protein KIN20_027986 [Parelaphostrongylus tenuis]|uniref:Uncharacterized protein n=1 Tax=Parelaphostrongylus tenuis TaxID=148309 RepID=A0AAD5WEF7_PARTN|nr:hypothetical protein KIN20_027986 [Parelaphostrongylus tenuis]
MATDMDSRVRLAAIEGLSLLSGVEDGVSVHTYNTVKNVIVRTEAATILGQFHSVSDAFLDQTLDMKLMKSVRYSTEHEQVRKVHQSAMTQGPERPPRKSRWKSSYQSIQSREQSSSSEWSSGKELNTRCTPTGPGASLDDDTENIAPHGARDAFVSALEDEFMSVRRAAVYSLGQLAATRPAFATTALDYLADMCNDEIVEVRMDSIAALIPLTVHGKLQKEHLETILKCLYDTWLHVVARTWASLVFNIFWNLASIGPPHSVSTLLTS